MAVILLYGRSPAPDIVRHGGWQLDLRWWIKTQSNRRADGLGKQFGSPFFILREEPMPQDHLATDRGIVFQTLLPREQCVEERMA